MRLVKQMSFQSCAKYRQPSMLVASAFAADCSDSEMCDLRYDADMWDVWFDSGMWNVRCCDATLRCEVWDCTLKCELWDSTLEIWGLTMKCEMVSSQSQTSGSCVRYLLAAVVFLFCHWSRFQCKRRTRHDVNELCDTSFKKCCDNCFETSIRLCVLWRTELNRLWNCYCFETADIVLWKLLWAFSDMRSDYERWDLRYESEMGDLRHLRSDVWDLKFLRSDCFIWFWVVRSEMWDLTLVCDKVMWDLTLRYETWIWDSTCEIWLWAWRREIWDLRCVIRLWDVRSEKRALTLWYELWD